MNLVIATIPENPLELPGWLERRLVGLELDGLVAELTAIHKPAARNTPGLAEVLGPKLDEVRRSGLSCLSQQQLRILLTRPSLLLALQEEVLISGGRYWDDVSHSMPLVKLKVEEGRKRLPVSVGNNQNTTVLAKAAPRGTSWYAQAWLLSLATAALVMVGVGVWMWSQSAPAGWGWQASGALAQDSKASEYLNGLANSAEEWFKKRPEDPAALAKRLGELRQGCSALIRSPHRPLAENDKDWLVGRCKAWALEFDKALVALDDGKDAIEVRGQVDKVIEKLATALRERAKGV